MFQKQKRDIGIGFRLRQNGFQENENMSFVFQIVVKQYQYVTFLQKNKKDMTFHQPYKTKPRNEK